jgi:hypothetical protein
MADRRRTGGGADACRLRPWSTTLPSRTSSNSAVQWEKWGVAKTAGALILANDVERVLADIDADYGGQSVEFLRYRVFLVSGAPCQHSLRAGREHGRTIPLADSQGIGVFPLCANRSRSSIVTLTSAPESDELVI